MPLRRVLSHVAIGVLVASAAEGQAPAVARLRGRVTDAESGSPVHATVTVMPGSVVARTDSAGRFAVVVARPGAVTVVAAALGYRIGRAAFTIAAGSDTTIALALAPVAYELATIRTAADRTAEHAQARAPAGASVTSLSARELSAIPAVGETDVLRAASLLPGIAARNDFWAGFNVRGGESDQTQVRLDGLPVFSPFHLGGLFSTFIPESVREVDARVGALPASVGGRLSGSLDVESAEDTRDGVHGAVDLSVISATAKLGGALPKVPGSWNVAARRTYADALADVVMGRGAFPYHFQDAQLHAALQTPGGGTLALTGYAGLDLLNPTAESNTDALGADRGSEFRFDWGNRLAGLSLHQPLGARTDLVQRVAYSAFSTAYDDDSLGVRLANTIAELRLSGEITRRFGGAAGTRLALRGGYELGALRTRYDEHISALGADDLGSLVIDDTLITQRSAMRTAFAEALWTPGERLSVRAGVRAEQVPHADWSAASPRVAVKYRALDRLSLSLAAGKYAQWVHAVRNEDLPVRIVDIWFASDAQVPVSTGEELVGGGELWLGRNDFLRVEGYTKRFADLVEPVSTVDPRLRPDELRRFGGTSRGFEILLRHLATERLSGWLAYSYGRSVREAGGERYAPAHDRRHDGNVVVSYRVARYIVAARLGVASGTPYTGWAGTYARWSYDPVTRRWRVPGPTSGARNEQVRTARNVERYPTYRRLDVGAHRPFRMGRYESDAFVNLVNVMNQRNVLLYAFDTEQNPPLVRGFSQLPFLPTLGLRVAF